jgi:hypothetical protein
MATKSYYHPAIEEFYVGFEFESIYGKDYEKVITQGFEEVETIKMIFQPHAFNQFDKGPNGISVPKVFAVRYLDEELITGEGWYPVQDPIGAYMNNPKIEVMWFQRQATPQYYMSYVQSHHQMGIYCKYEGLRRIENIVFSGCIRNVNELRKITKWLELDIPEASQLLPEAKDDQKQLPGNQNPWP